MYPGARRQRAPGLSVRYATRCPGYPLRGHPSGLLCARGVFSLAGTCARHPSNQCLARVETTRCFIRDCFSGAWVHAPHVLRRRASGAAMVRAGRGFVHGVPMSARLAPACVCLGLGVEALNSGTEALSSSVDALRFGVREFALRRRGFALRRLGFSLRQ